MIKGRAPKSGQRTPSGQLSRAGRVASQAVAPAALARARDAVLAMLADPLWETELGRMHLRGELNAVQTEAGKRWCNLARAYLRAINARGIKSPSFEGASSTVDPDPESERGQMQTKHDIYIIDDFKRAKEALEKDGVNYLKSVVRLCSDDKQLEFVDKAYAIGGLNSLAIHFGLTKKAC
jgi:hypothetical protein